MDTGYSLHVETFGSGPRVVFVHGGMTTAAQTWEKQRPLADRWTLVLPTRRGFEPNPYEDVDFENDATDLAPLLEGGAHLVGHSYGGLGVLFAAAAHPDRVHSLTLAETPLMALARGRLDVEQSIDDFHDRRDTIVDVADFYMSFLSRLGAPIGDVPDPLPPETERLVQLLMHERPPWEAEIPVDKLRAAPFPTLVVTGGWDDAIEAGADALVAGLGISAQRAVITGRGHVVQRTGEPFNERLEAFLNTAEAR